MLDVSDRQENNVANFVQNRYVELSSCRKPCWCDHPRIVLLNTSILYLGGILRVTYSSVFAEIIYDCCVHFPSFCTRKGDSLYGNNNNHNFVGSVR